ncbi:hypothetical protein [Paracoccus sp. ME4]|uniref:hypothetical protein n=1 Tax=Paracoccus sp. ME4 TaxID=3138066 RepID=UPI00398B681A
MRDARTDLQLIMGEGDSTLPIALSLGFDFVAEHEMGISGIRRLVGASDAELGIERHRADPDRAMNHLTSVTLPKTRSAPECHVLELSPRRMNDADQASWKKAVRRPDIRWDKEGYTSSWDERSFRICAIDPEVVAFLKDFESALANGNAAVMHLSLSPGNPFSRSSLGLVVIDRLPGSAIEAMRESDIDQRLLREQFGKLGFDEVFRSKGIRVCACSPRRIDADQMASIGTDYPMNLWVNSWDERLRTGWFTVEELQDTVLDLFPDATLREYWGLVHDEMMIRTEDHGLGLS